MTGKSNVIIKVVKNKYGNFNDFFVQITKNSRKVMNNRQKIDSITTCVFPVHYFVQNEKKKEMTQFLNNMNDRKLKF